MKIGNINKGVYKKLMEEFDKNIDQVSLYYVNEEDNVLLKDPYKKKIKEVYQNLLVLKMDIL